MNFKNGVVITVDGSVQLFKFDGKERDVIVSRWSNLFYQRIYKGLWYSFCECLRHIREDYIYAWIAPTVGEHDRKLGKTEKSLYAAK
jgi:hypothetical protein